MSDIFSKIEQLKQDRNALETLEPQINISEELRLRALKPLERMLALS